MRSAQLHAWNSSNLLINTARIAGAMHFWTVLWNIPDPSKENYPALMIWPGSNLHSSLFFFLFFPSSQGLMEVCKYFEPPSPLRFHKLCFQALEGTVVNAMWLTDSHFSRFWFWLVVTCSSHKAAEYSSLHPFLVLSPTVPFCCTSRWEWVLGFVSWLYAVVYPS